MSHAPGPWSVRDAVDHGFAEAGRRYADQIRDSNGDVIASVTATASPNAALIAASPDLLEWAEKSAHDLNCSSFRTNFMGVVHRDGPCNCGRDAAIAKARGGAR